MLVDLDVALLVHDRVADTRGLHGLLSVLRGGAGKGGELTFAEDGIFA